MTLNPIDVEATVANVRQLLAQETRLSPALRSALEVLILIVQLLGRLNLNSRNRSQPPSQDRFPVRAKKSSATGRQPGASLGAWVRPSAPLPIPT